MLMEGLRTKRCKKSSTTSRSGCRQGKKWTAQLWLKVGRPGRRKKWVRGSEFPWWSCDQGRKRIEGKRNPAAFYRSFFPPLFSGLNASLRSGTFSWRRKKRMCKSVTRKRFPGSTPYQAWYEASLDYVVPKRRWIDLCQCKPVDVVAE